MSKIADDPTVREAAHLGKKLDRMRKNVLRDGQYPEKGQEAHLERLRQKMVNKYAR